MSTASWIGGPEACATQEYVTRRRVAKVVCVLADGWPYEVVLPDSRRLSLDRLRELLGANDVRLGSAEELARYFPEGEQGVLPALRHWEGVEVIVDGHLACNGDIIILGDTRRDALRINFDDWFDLVN